MTKTIQKQNKEKITKILIRRWLLSKQRKPVGPSPQVTVASGKVRNTYFHLRKVVFFASSAKVEGERFKAHNWFLQKFMMWDSNNFRGIQFFQTTKGPGPFKVPVKLWRVSVETILPDVRMGPKSHQIICGTKDQY